MGCLDGLLRWKSIYSGKMLYQEYDSYGKGILSKVMSSLTNKNSFIYDFSIFLNFVSSLVTEETYHFPPWSSTEFYYELFLVWRRQRKCCFHVKNGFYFAYYLFSLQFSYEFVITPLSQILSSLFILGNKYFSQIC